MNTLTEKQQKLVATIAARAKRDAKKLQEMQDKIYYANKGADGTLGYLNVSVQNLSTAAHSLHALATRTVPKTKVIKNTPLVEALENGEVFLLNEVD